MMIRQFQELEKRFEKSKFDASFLIAIFKNYQLTTSEFVTTYYCIGNPFDFLSGEVMLLWYGNKTDHLFKKKIRATLGVENSGEIPRKSLLSRPVTYFGRHWLMCSGRLVWEKFHPTCG